MKIEKLRTQTNAELNKQLNELKAELFNLRFSNATGSLQNPLALNTCKKDIAKIMTILRERELGISKVVEAPATSKKESAKETSKSTKKTTSKKSESKKD